MPILVTDAALYTVWLASLGLGIVVIAVVAILLLMIARAAEEIRGVVGRIWTVGQRIANNTIHIPLLVETNRVVAEVLERASGIHRAAAAIADHAERCPGCPRCVLGSGGRRMP